jgi:hypothetical protein
MRTNSNDRTDAAETVQGHWLFDVVTRQHQCVTFNTSLLPWYESVVGVTGATSGKTT